MVDIEANEYSVLKFYNRRVKRILPALIVVLIVTTLLSMWLMFPDDFNDYQSSLIATLLFYSNYFFMFDVGYFAAPAESKPLLHMWSLAVEEQFYLLYPLYLLIFKRVQKKLFLLCTSFLLLLSFIYAIDLLNESVRKAFYSTPSRVWELMAGSMLAVLNNNPIRLNKWVAESLAVIGLVCILISVLLYSQNTAFPGLAAFPPVLGTVLIIWLGCHHETFVGRILSIKPFVFVGLISYSLYLWHVPILVFYKKYNIGVENQLSFIICLVTMFIVAYLSWRFIEAPFRKNSKLLKSSTLRPNFKGATLIIGIIVVIYAAVFNFQKPLTPEIKKILSANSPANKAAKLNDCFPFGGKDSKLFEACVIGEMSNTIITFAVIGDSHGKMYLAGLDQAAKQHGRKGVFIGEGGCLALIGVQQASKKFDHCQQRTDEFINYLTLNPQIKDIMLISRWAVYAEGEQYKNAKGRKIILQEKQNQSQLMMSNHLVFERAFIRTMEVLQKLGLNIFILNQTPDSNWSAKELALAQVMHPATELVLYKSEYENRLSFVNQVFNKHQETYGFTLISPSEIMCDDEKCQIIDQNGVSIYRDNAHITRSFSVAIKQIFNPLFKFPD